MCSREVLRPLGITASILGIIQGLLGTAFFIFGILVYTGEVIIDYPTTPNHFHLVFYAIIETYFVDSPKVPFMNGTYKSIDLLVTSDLLFIWQIAYLVLSFLWAICSMFLFYVMWHQKELKYKTAVGSWVGSATLVALCDLSISILMAIDYFYVFDLISETMSMGRIIYYESLLTLLTIFDRGIILWIVNVFLIITLLTLLCGTDSKPINRGPFNAPQTFGTNQSLPPPQNLNNYQHNHLQPVPNTPIPNGHVEKADNGVYNPIYAWLDPNASDKVNIPRVPLQQRTFVKRIFNFHNKMQRSNSRNTTHGSAEDLFNPPPSDGRPHSAPVGGGAPNSSRSGGAPPPPPPPMPPPPTPSLGNGSVFSFPTMNSSMGPPLKSALKKNQHRPNNGPIMR